MTMVHSEWHLGLTVTYLLLYLSFHTPQLQQCLSTSLGKLTLNNKVSG